MYNVSCEFEMKIKVIYYIYIHIIDGPGGDYFVTRFLPSLNKAYTHYITEGLPNEPEDFQQNANILCW